MCEIPRHPLSAILLLASLSLWTPAATASETPGLRLSIEGADGGSISLTLAGDAVAGVLRELTGHSLSCDSDLDGDAEAMLRHLDRQGEGSRYRIEEDDQVVVASRRRGHLELEVEGRDGGAEISLPWAFAECMLGREADWSGDGEIRIKVRGEGGALELLAGDR